MSVIVDTLKNLDLSQDTILSSLQNKEGYLGLWGQITAEPKTYISQDSVKYMQMVSPGLPLVLTVGYILMVFTRNLFVREGIGARPLVIAWNFILATFSIAGAFFTIPYTLDILTGHGTSTSGFTRFLCNPVQGQYNGVVGYWVFLFILSKIPELVDTILLVIQKKPVILLHWYHHFTVMLFCWNSWIVQSSAGLFYATMNFTVHAIMYSYYFLMCFKIFRPLVKPIAPFITLIQIIQMVGGLIISGLSFIALDEGKKCSGLDTFNVQAGTIMYFSYFVLFAKLFNDNYLGGKKKNKPAAGAASKVQRK